MTIIKPLKIMLKSKLSLITSPLRSIKYTSKGQFANQTQKYAEALNNVHVNTSKEPTMVLLIIMIITMIILSLRTFKRQTPFIIIRFIIGTFITLFIVYSSWLFVQWYSGIIEGTFSYRFLSFVKKASLDEKLAFYNTIIIQMIEIIKNTNNNLGLYLEQSPSVISPSSTILMNTSYNMIANLAEKNILFEKNQYIIMMNNIAHATPSTISNHSWRTFIKITIATITVITIAIIISNYIGFDVKGTFKKALNNLGQTQDEMILLNKKLGEQNANLIALNQIVGRVDKYSDILSMKMNSLVTTVDVLQNNAERSAYLINKVIRPCIQATFTGVNYMDNVVGKTILSTLKEEQKDFITTVSKLVFNP